MLFVGLGSVMLPGRGGMSLGRLAYNTLLVLAGVAASDPSACQALSAAAAAVNLKFTASDSD